MAPYNSEFIQGESNELGHQKFVKFFKEINKSFDMRFLSPKIDSKKELHKFLKASLLLEYKDCNNGEKRVSEFTPEYFDLYKGLDGIYLFRQLVSCDRDSLSMFTDDELEQFTVSLMDFESSDSYDLENPDTCLLFIDMEENRGIVALRNDFIDDTKYYMLLEARWNDDVEYEKLNSLFGV